MSFAILIIVLVILTVWSVRSTNKNIGAVGRLTRKMHDEGWRTRIVAKPRLGRTSYQMYDVEWYKEDEDSPTPRCDSF